MKKVFFVFFTIVFIIIVGEMMYYFSLSNPQLTAFFRKNNQKESQEPSATISLTPTPSQTSSYQILYQAPNDVSGRTIVYSGRSGIALNGSGKIYEKADSLTIHVGQVVKFETIPDSDDEHILLKDPINGTFLIKGRISFNADGEQTDFRVEKLADNNSTEAVIESLGLSNALGKSTIHNIIQEGDIVALLTKHKQNTEEEYIAARLILRRFNGKTEIEKEIGRSL